MAVQPSQLAERAHRMRLEAVAVGAALAIVVGSVAIAAGVLLHEAPASPQAAVTQIQTAPQGRAPSILYSDPQALALAERSGDVLFGLAASPSGTVDVLIQTGDGNAVRRSALRVQTGSGAELRPTACGSSCFRLAAGALQGAPVQLDVTVVRPGKPDATAHFALPSTMPANGDQLLAKVQARMGGLHSVHVAETLTAGLGLVVRTQYDLEAPDRLRFTTSQGQRVVIVGRHRYDFQGGKWVASPFPETRSPSYIWKGASRARLLGPATVDGQPVQVLALFLPRREFPAWFRLAVRPDGQVLEADMLGPSHFMVNRFSGFDEPVSIEVPQ